MRFIPHGLLMVSLFLILGCGTKVAKQPETDTQAIMPKYVIDAKELFGIGTREAAAKVSAATDAPFHRYSGSDISYARSNFDYGRTEPYFRERRITPIATFTMNHKAYLSLCFTRDSVVRVELTHSGVVSAEEAVMMLGYDPKQLIEHPVKHRNAERSDWFAVIDPYFHIIEIQWFDAKQLDTPGKFGRVTQIRVSVW